MICGSVLAGGCGGRNAAAGVRSTLGDFGRAAAHKDYRTMCRRLLAPSLVEQVEGVGIPCETALAKGLGAVQRPSLKVRTVTVAHGRAFAVVHSTAAGQPPSDDTVELVHARDGWRIASLAQSTGAPAGQQPGY